MAKLLNQEWYNEQEYSTYPFSDNATLSDGTVSLSKSLFTDARLYPIGGKESQYLSSIEVRRDKVIFTISDISGELCSGGFTFSSSEDTVALTDTYNRPAGVLVSSAEKLQLLSAWVIDTYTFEHVMTAFTATVIIPCPQIGLRGFITESGEFFSGSTWLIGEQGIFLTNEETGEIRVDIVGDPAARRKLCDDLGSYDSSGILKTISGLSSNNLGDFKLMSGNRGALDTVFRVYPTANGIQLKLIGGVLKDAEN